MPGAARVSLVLGGDDLLRAALRLAVAGLLVVGLALTFLWATLGGLFGMAQGPVGSGALAEIPPEQLAAASRLVAQVPAVGQVRRSVDFHQISGRAGRASVFEGTLARSWSAR